MITSIAQDLLSKPESELTSSDIPLLENCLTVLSDAHLRGESLVADSVYDALKARLELIAPNSSILGTLWDEVPQPSETFDEFDVFSDFTDEGSLDIHLRSHPMHSIRTIKSWDDKNYLDFCDSFINLPNPELASLHFSAKLDGHGVRLVYKDGKFVKATSRARSTKGRDLTRQLSVVVPQTIPLMGITEIRGEVVLDQSRLDDVRRLNASLKTAFTAVSSLLAPSSTQEENEFLSFLAYRVFSTDPSFVSPATRSDEYSFLTNSLNFETPIYTSEPFVGYSSVSDFSYDLQEAFTSFCDSIADCDYPYILDGVVVEIDHRNLALYASMDNNVYTDGALALKTDSYSQGIYAGYVLDIVWKPGRTKFSPVAVVSDDGETPGVLTSSGLTVTNVPLYEPINILAFQSFIGEVLSFKFGGQSGVVPCFPDGSVLGDLDSTVRDALLQ